MFVKICKPSSVPGKTNKSSSICLVDYLEKENEGKSVSEREDFFDHTADAVLKHSVIDKIDSNNRNLGYKDNKFFMLSVNPSQRELKHLIQRTTGKEVQSLNELSKEERKKLSIELKDYTRGVMDIYAKNFQREAIKSGSDLVYFGKIETSRKYKHFDPLVRENKAISKEIVELQKNIESSSISQTEKEQLKTKIQDLEARYHRQSGEIIKGGMQKEGLQMHVHVVVSRNNKNQNVKLSPLSRSKGGFQKLNGKDVMQGFHHERFKVDAQALFAEKYNYRATSKECYVSKTSHQVAHSFAEKKCMDTIGSLKNQVLKGEFFEEKKVFNSAKEAVNLIKNPKAQMLSSLKEKFFKILAEAGKDKY